MIRAGGRGIFRVAMKRFGKCANARKTGRLFVLAAMAAAAFCAFGETWHLAGDDGGGTSSLVSGQGAGWETADGSQTTKVVGGEDDYVIDGHQMRTPEGSDVTFGGRSLSMTGGTILFKGSKDDFLSVQMMGVMAQIIPAQ